MRLEPSLQPFTSVSLSDKMAETAAKIVGVIASMEKGLFIDGAFAEGQRKET